MISSKAQHQLHNSSFRGCCSHDYGRVCSLLRLYSRPSYIFHRVSVTMETRASKTGQQNPRKFHWEGHVLKIAHSPKAEGPSSHRGFGNTLFDFPMAALLQHCVKTPLHVRHSVSICLCCKWLICKCHKEKCKITSGHDTQQGKRGMSTCGVSFFSC